MRARWLLLFVPSLLSVSAFAACGSDETAPPETTSVDASTGNTDATTTPTPTSTNQPPADAAPDSNGNVDGGGGDADADAGPPPTSCSALHAQSPALPSGIYTIDPDGAGPVAALPAYCDMVFDGGGWTLIYSTIPAHSLDAPGDAGTDASPDAAFYVRPPAPAMLGAFKGEFVQPLAATAKQVHIRTPFEADAGADGGSAWISSIVLPDGGTTKPIQNLRSLFGTNRNAGGFADWTGPYANADRLSYQETAGCAAVNTAVYPLIYWACNNTNGLHISSDKARWIYVSDNAPNEAIEVYVR